MKKSAYFLWIYLVIPALFQACTEEDKGNILQVEMNYSPENILTMAQELVETPEYISMAETRRSYDFAMSGQVSEFVNSLDETELNEYREALQAAEQSGDATLRDRIPDQKAKLSQ